MSKIRIDEENMPLEVRKDMQYIERTKLGFSCKVCMTPIELTTSNLISTNNLTLHCKGKYHKRKLSVFKDNSKPLQENTNKGLILYQDNEIILNTDSKVDTLIEQNELYVIWKKDSWFCLLCRLNIPFSTQKKCRNNLAFHLDSSAHQIKFKPAFLIDSRKFQINSTGPVSIVDIGYLQAQSMLKKLLNTSFVTQVNEQYFAVKENKFFCELCKESIACSRNSSLLEEHCHSNTHICNLHTMVCGFLSGLPIGNKVFTLSGNELQDVVSELKDCFLCVAPSMKFIHLKGKQFICLLCNILLKRSEKDVDFKTHFVSKTHKELSHRLMCNKYNKPNSSFEVLSVQKQKSKSPCNISVKKSQTDGGLKTHIVSQTHIEFCPTLLCNQNNKPNSSFEVLSLQKQKSNSPNSKVKNRQVHVNTTKIKKRKEKKKSDTEKQKRNVLTSLEDKIPEESSFPISFKEDEVVTRSNFKCLSKYLEKLKKKFLEVNLNENYLKPKEGKVYCEACKELIDCSISESFLKQHCQSVSHNMKLSRIAIDYLSKTKYRKSSSESNEKSKIIMRRMFKEFPSIKSTNHLEFIVHNETNFICRLCNRSMEMAGKGSSLVHHFSSDDHKERAYKLFCSPAQGNKFSSPKNDSDSFKDEDLFPLCEDKRISHGENFTFSDEESIVEDIPDSWEDLALTTYEEDISNPIQDFRDKLSSKYSENKLHDQNSFGLSESSDQTISNYQVFSHTVEDSTNKNRGFRECLPSVNSKERLLDESSFNLLVSFDENKPEDEGFKFITEECSQIVVMTEVPNKCLVDSNSVLDNEPRDNILCLSPPNIIFPSVNGQSMVNSTESGIGNSKVFGNKSKIHTNIFATVLKTQSEQKNKLKYSDSDNIDQSKFSNVGMEALLKSLFKQNIVTKINSQYFCIRNEQIFCEVCQETIQICEDTMLKSLFKNHCYSKQHNNILNNVATDFVSNCNNTIQSSQSENDCDKLKLVLSNLQKTYPFVKFKHLLKYIWFESDLFICLLCHQPVTYTKEGNLIISHINSKLHKIELKQNVFKYVSIKKNRTVENFVVSSEIGHENVVKSDEEENSTVDVSCSVPNPKENESADVSTIYLETTLKCLLKTNNSTSLHSQYFCIKDTNFFCHVCSEEIKFTKCLSPLDIHCKSFKHNNVLENIAIEFMSINRNKFQTFITKENSNKFNKALCELREQAPFSDFKYCLLYITFDSKYFICMLCEKTLPFAKRAKCVYGHILNCIFHKNRSLELVLKHVSMMKNKSQVDEDLSPKNLYENIEDNNTDEKPSKSDSCPLPVVTNDHEAILEHGTHSESADSKLLKTQALLASLRPDQNEGFLSAGDTAKDTIQPEKTIQVKSDSLSFGEKNLCTSEENFKRLTPETHKNDTSHLSENKCYQVGNEQGNSKMFDEDNVSNTHVVELPHLPETEIIHMKIDTCDSYVNNNLQASNETFSKPKKNDLPLMYATERTKAPNYVSLDTSNTLHGVFEIREESFVCTICNCSLFKKNSNSCLEQIMETHITSPEHEENVKIYQFIRNTSLDNLMKSKLSMILHDNRQFIERRGLFFHCTICNLNFPNLNNDMFSHLNFASHLESFNHHKFPLNYPVPSDTTCSQSELHSVNHHKINSKLPDHFAKSADSPAGHSNNDRSEFVEATEDQVTPEDKICSSCPNSEEGISFCPECKEMFEVYNNDLEFSLQVHAQKHKTFSEVNELADNKELLESLGTHKSFILQENSEYFCDLCKCKLILSWDKMLALQSLHQHIQTPYHLNQYDLFVEESCSSLYFDKPVVKTVDAKKEKLNSLLGQVNSYTIKKNKEFIEVKKNKFFCTLCSKTMDVSSNSDINVYNLETHFIGFCHKEHLNSYQKP